MPCACHGMDLSRRALLRGIGATTFVAGTGGLSAAAWAERYDEGDFTRRLMALVEAAGGDTIAEAMPFALTGTTAPWDTKLMDVRAGQAVTFLLSGRWYLARDLDLWLEPGFVFFARSPGGALYNAMENVGTMIADRDGPLEIARSAGELADATGALAIPIDAYTAADGRVEGIAIAWKTDPVAGLRRLIAQGDVDGAVQQALQRAEFPDVTPAGWHNHFHFGEAGVFRQDGAEMACHTHKTVSILQRDVNMDLVDGLKLDWDWLVDELPSRVAEDQMTTHDYLSIGVEFDDGQDLTYFWSAQLPVGHVFRCPLPGWNAIETHLVQRSGLADLGAWQSESRDVTADYHAHIGGPARRAVRVWLLGVSVFQRQTGSCRYRNVSIGQDSAASRLTLV